MKCQSSWSDRFSENLPFIAEELGDFRDPILEPRKQLRKSRIRLAVWLNPGRIIAWEEYLAKVPHPSKIAKGWAA